MKLVQQAPPTHTSDNCKNQGMGDTTVDTQLGSLGDPWRDHHIQIGNGSSDRAPNGGFFADFAAEYHFPYSSPQSDLSYCIDLLSVLFFSGPPSSPIVQTAINNRAVEPTKPV